MPHRGPALPLHEHCLFKLGILLGELWYLTELAAWLPEFAERINAIQGRLWDLLRLIRNHVYHPAFAGSYSLKAVLPALVPEKSYEGMAVANGQDAGLAWDSLVRGSLDQVERDKIKTALLDYCGQDTLALTALLQKLREAEFTAQETGLVHHESV